MSDLVERILERGGGKEAFAKNSKIGRALQARGVVKSGEFLRVSAIPRRRWEGAPDLEELIEVVTGALAVSADYPLWPVQVAALRDAHDLGGAFLPIGVGRGKTLISLLAASVISAERPLLIVPAQLRDKTLRCLDVLAKEWVIREDIKIISYTLISLEKNASFLEEFAPDLIVMDECHRLSNPKSGRTKRVHRYLRVHPETKVVAMSGTITKRSIRDYAHIIRWALKERTPLPETWGTLCEWADALDARVPDEKRVAPGALLNWCAPGETVREGYGRRLTETPGVVASSGAGDVDASLRIDRWDYRPPQQIHAALNRLENAWTLPNGDEVAEAADKWRHSRTIAQGFFHRWDPPAPKAWMLARRDWKRHVREVLAHNRRQLDTELQVWKDCEAKGLAVWRTWAEIKKSFEPNSVAYWVTLDVVEAAARWMEEHRGIVWIENPAVGKQLARISGRRYFGAGDSKIDLWREPCIASITAQNEGNDLQHFACALVLAPPATGKIWEQLLGRLHRSGQESDEVVYSIYLPCRDLEDSFELAREDAHYLEETSGGGRQKLNFADVVI